MLNNNTEISQNIKNTIAEFKNIGTNQKIPEPEKTLKITTIPDKIAQKLRLQNKDVLITRKALKHIVERRDIKAYEFVGSIPDVLNNPTKIGDNSAKRANSYLFAKMNGKAKGVVLEVIKKPEENQVVSCYFIDKKTYNKLVDISGRTESLAGFPSSVRSGLIQNTAESGRTKSPFSALQKPTDLNIAKNSGIVKFKKKKSYENNRDTNYSHKT